VSDPTTLLQTPLHAEHVRLGARMVDFGGWSMPVQYTGILDEHYAVRNGLGVFDISHMGQFFAEGPQARDWLNTLLTNNVERLAVGECQYTFLLNEQGGVIDDLIVYRVGDDRYLLVVNASKVDEDFAWMRSHLRTDVELRDESSSFAGLAVQGPRSAQLFDAFFEGRYSRPRATKSSASRSRMSRISSPDGLHRRGRVRGFLPAGRAARPGTTSSSADRLWDQAVRTRRPAIRSAGDVLPLEWERSFRRYDSARGGDVHFR
jgi:hypothetical protein